MTALPAIELSYGTALGVQYRVRRVDFGDGYSQRAPDGLNTEIQTWVLTWQRIPDSQAETLRLFFKALGGTGIVDWTPYNQTDPLKFTANNFSSKPSGTLISDVQVTLTQEFDL